MKPLLTYLAPLRKLLRRALPYWAVAMLKSAWAEYSFRSFNARVVRHRYGAYDLQVELIDFDGASWLDKDYEESAFAEIAMLKRHKLGPGAKVFNAGANQCLQAMMMAREAKPGGFVWAIEPNPHNVQAGLRNCELNDIDNVKLIEAAVSSTRGQLWFNRAMNGQVAVSQHEAGAHLVEVVTIDDLSANFGPPDVLYIDVEGFECEVLEGARATLGSHAPDCFVEVHLQTGLERYGGSMGKVLSFFPSSRYDLYYSHGDDGVFRQVATNTVLPQKRFYLVALARSDARSLYSTEDMVLSSVG
jgi:FkbM family methyltransferase